MKTIIKAFFTFVCFWGPLKIVCKSLNFIFIFILLKNTQFGKYFVRNILFLKKEVYRLTI